MMTRRRRRRRRQGLFLFKLFVLKGIDITNSFIYLWRSRVITRALLYYFLLPQVLSKSNLMHPSG
jgi:hypothetical protein